MFVPSSHSVAPCESCSGFRPSAHSYGYGSTADAITAAIQGATAITTTAITAANQGKSGGKKKKAAAAAAAPAAASSGWVKPVLIGGGVLLAGAVAWKVTRPRRAA